MAMAHAMYAAGDVVAPLGPAVSLMCSYALAWGARAVEGARRQADGGVPLAVVHFRDGHGDVVDAYTRSQRMRASERVRAGEAAEDGDCMASSSGGSDVDVLPPVPRSDHEDHDVLGLPERARRRLARAAARTAAMSRAEYAVYASSRVASSFSRGGAASHVATCVQRRRRRRVSLCRRV